MIRTLVRCAVKESTGYVGFPVIPEARKVLFALYGKILEEIKAVPEGVFYRTSIERQTHHRLKILQETEDVFEIEEKINSGQVEELIQDAENELSLIPDYVKFRPWDVPEDHVIPLIIRDAMHEVEGERVQIEGQVPEVIHRDRDVLEYTFGEMALEKKETV